jgi:endonuclease/exonuclease/phosphatase family metal-dependent hydrolase
VVTFNILLGGARREAHIRAVLQRVDADVVVLEEASNREFVSQVADQLGMTAVVGDASDGTGLNIAVLSRLRILHSHNHQHPGAMLRSHLEVVVGTGGTRIPELRLHALHLAARFGERNKGEARRRRELDAVFGDLADATVMPHVVLGDFNALADGDHVEATAFFAKMGELRRARAVVRRANGMVVARPADDGEDAAAAWLRAGVDPRLDVGIPALPIVVYPLTALMPRSVTVDRLLGRTIERWTVPRMLAAGYTDSFRHLHPRAHGYTCATWLPAARIDYQFADPVLASRLLRCEVVGSRGWPDREAVIASDHFPLVAEYSV